MDCPWCGCGWLFICSQCRKAFTFAQGVEIGESWEVTGDRIVRAYYQREPERGEVEKWVEFMKILLKEVNAGDKYVYFDGYVVPATAGGLTLEGWHTHHDLSSIPQVAALTNPAVLDNLLGSRDYWLSNLVERDDG
jgi:hypothetical protein